MLPALLPIIGAAGGLLGGGAKAIGEGLKDFSNVGKNKFQATPYQANPVQFGGDGGAARFEQQGQRGLADARAQGAYANAQMQADRGPQAMENGILANREAQGRGYQMDSLGLARQAAMGNAPSVAARQMQAGLDQAVAGQQSAMGSARGAAGLALAGSNAQASVANLQNQTFNQAAQLRAQEMATARGQYQAGSDSLRQADQGRLQMGNQMGQFNANLNDQYRMGMGQLGLGYQQAQQGWNQATMDPWKAQMQADGQNQQINADSYNQAQAINAGVSQGNADESGKMRDRWVNYGMGAVNTAGKFGGK